MPSITKHPTHSRSLSRRVYGMEKQANPQATSFRTTPGPKSESNCENAIRNAAEPIKESKLFNKGTLDESHYALIL